MRWPKPHSGVEVDAEPGSATRAPPRRGSGLVLHPCQDVLRHADELTVLVDDADLAARAALDRIDGSDCVGEGDGVADVDGAEEANVVVPKRDRCLVAGGATAFLDHERGA